MIPLRLNSSSQPGRRVRTPYGLGVTEVRRLSDLLLPSGQVIIGYPGNEDTFTNQPSETVPVVTPGSYPVLLTVAVNRRAVPRPPGGSFAALTVLFKDSSPVHWQSAGSFFTDSGDGCIVDREAVSHLRSYRNTDRERWFKFKYQTLADGDGSILFRDLQANAIVWKTANWTYDAFLGLDADGQIARLVIDGRWYRLRDCPWQERLRRIWRYIAYTPLTRKGREEVVFNWISQEYRRLEREERAAESSRKVDLAGTGG